METIKATVQSIVPQQPQFADPNRIAAEQREMAMQNRQNLKALSNKLKQACEPLIKGERYISINTMLRDYYKQSHTITELQTYEEWQKRGYQVLRGQKAYLFWGAKTKSAQGFDYYPLLYLFDKSQCDYVEFTK